MALKDKKTQAQDKGSSEVIEKFKANPLLYIGSVLVLVLVTVTFVGGDLISGRSRRAAGGDLTFGYYDKVPISYVPGNIFSQYWNQIANNIQNYYGMDINDPNIAPYIWQQAFESAAVHTAILQEVKRSNYEVPEKMVNREIAQMPEFQENGKFSTVLYHRVPETTRIAQWQQVRDELTKIIYFGDLLGLLVPSSEAEFFGNMSSEKRFFQMVSFQVDDYPDSEYLAFARENSFLFNTIHLSRITVNSRREADRILASVKDGTSTFEDAAKNHSKDYYGNSGGDMGIRYIFELEREIPESEREKIIMLDNGQLSDVIEIDDAWVFFRVENQLIPPYFEDEAVMEKVRSFMRNDRGGIMENWAIERANEFIADAQSSSFDDAINRLGKEKRSFGPLPVNYGSVDLFETLESFSVPELANSSANENFWKAAFSTKINTLSEPVVQGRNVLVFMPTEENLTGGSDDGFSIEDVKDNYSSYWLRSTTEQTIQSFFMNSGRMEDNFRETYIRLMYGD